METRIDPERFVEMVQAIYRLFRVATFHRVDNEAVGRAIETCRRAMHAFADQGQGLTLLFARDTVIVNGQLLQAPPDVYELAMEFGRFLTASGRNSFYIGADVGDDELRSLLGFFRERRAGAEEVDPQYEPDARGYLTPNIRLRWIRDELLVGLEDPRLTAFERVMLTYALAARVIRRLLDEVSGDRPEIPSFFKRVARQLALVDYASRPRVLDVTVGRHDGRDPARVGVDSAIVATAMARRLTRDERVLARVALTAMTLDLGDERPKVDGVGTVDPSDPISTAVMHLRSGRLRSDAIDRTAVAFEARALISRRRASEVYQQRLYPSLEAFVVATARRFVEYLAAASTDENLPIDRAVESVRDFADTDEGLICADLLVAALTLVPRGTPVQLVSGHKAVVIAAAERPSLFELPQVVVVLDADDRPMQPVTVDLAADEAAREKYGGVDRVLQNPGDLIRGVIERVPGGAIELEWRARREGAIRQYRERLETPERTGTDTGMQVVPTQSDIRIPTVPKADPSPQRAPQPSGAPATVRAEAAAARPERGTRPSGVSTAVPASPTPERSTRPSGVSPAVPESPTPGRAPSGASPAVPAAASSAVSGAERAPESPAPLVSSPSIEAVPSAPELPSTPDAPLVSSPSIEAVPSTPTLENPTPAAPIPPPVGAPDPPERPTSRSQVRTPVLPLPAVPSDAPVSLPPVVDDREPPARRSQARTPVGGAEAIPDDAVPVERRADARPAEKEPPTATAFEDLGEPAPEPASEASDFDDAPNSFVRRALERRATGSSPVVSSADASSPGTSGDGGADDETDGGIDADAFADAPNSFVRRALARQTTGSNPVVPDDDAPVEPTSSPSFERRASGVHRVATDGASGAPAAGGIMRRRRRSTGANPTAARTGSGVHVTVSKSKRRGMTSTSNPTVPRAPVSNVDDATRERFREAARQHRLEKTDVDTLMREYVARDAGERPDTGQVEAVVEAHARAIEAAAAEGEGTPASTEAATDAPAGRPRRPTRPSAVNRVVETFDDVPDAAVETVDPDDD